MVYQGPQTTMKTGPKLDLIGWCTGWCVGGLKRLGWKGLLLVLILLAAFATAGYFYWQYAEAQRKLEDPREAAAFAVKDVTDRVGRLIVLPTDEIPTLATVTDAEKLKSQAFFTNAENGDKVLIYTRNRLAIIYRPSDNKIIAVGTVNLNQSGQ